MLKINLQKFASLTISKKNRLVRSLNYCFLKSESNSKLEINGNEKCIFRPAIPVQPHFDLIAKADYHKIYSDLIKLIESKTPIYFDFVPSKLINPLPILVSKSQLEEYNKIQEALYYSIQTIVSNYFNDKRIQEVFNFSKNVQQILEFYRNKSFDEVGSFRWLLFIFNKLNLPQNFT